MMITKKQLNIRGVLLARKFWNNLIKNNFTTKSSYKKYYDILGVNEDCDQEQLRIAYLALVKKFHPDNFGTHADATKFKEVDEAFRILTEKNSRERWIVEESEDLTVIERDIRHTAPQHRQYLNYDGVGMGTPFQRQKQYQQVRASQAAQNVMQHRVTKISASEHALWDKSKPKYKHDIKTKYGFDRLVEDLIQESMSKGEFNNLSGCGKPLKPKENRNPYVDLVTHKLNEVLIDNGFTPDWILLQKEIRENIELLKKGLVMERKYFGPFPLNSQDELKWESVMNKYDKLVQNINLQINKYNLVVPILNKQMFHVNLRKIAKRILIEGEFGAETNYPEGKRAEEEYKNTQRSLLELFSVFFK